MQKPLFQPVWPLGLVQLLDYPYREVSEDLEGHLAKCGFGGQVAPGDVSLSDVVVAALTWPNSVSYYNSAAAWIEQGMPLDETIVAAIDATSKVTTLPQSTRQRLFALARRWERGF